MNWKKVLFGDLECTKISKDGKVKTTVRFEGGLLPALLVIGLFGLVIWLVVK
ncbi:hypothetical protein [Streptococcus caballi]|uniref:hypothetical protein n=1 Tax=Streptococcus caballi TaxID=439220 RepID=UPI000371F9CE|nr:hypothetical protein [Streptococcus caballi]